MLEARLVRLRIWGPSCPGADRATISKAWSHSTLGRGQGRLLSILQIRTLRPEGVIEICRLHAEG